MMDRFDLTKLEVAMKYVQRIADGCNPVNNEPLDRDDVLNNPNIIRCMYFIKDILEEVRRNDGMVGSTRGKTPTIPFPMEILDDFEYREDMSITHVLKQIFEPVEDLNVKKVSVVKVTSALKEEGYLLDEPNAESGKMRKVPSEKGKKLGIYLVQREFNGRVYESVTYNKNAQEYVVAIVKRLIEG